MEARGKLAILRWWGKLVSMKHDRLCYQIYHYRRANMLANKKSWCKKVRELLYELELGPVWEARILVIYHGTKFSNCTLGKKRTKIGSTESLKRPSSVSIASLNRSSALRTI